MGLSQINSEEALRRLAQSQASAPDSIQYLCDCVRAEVHARKHVPRAVALSGVVRLLAPVISIDDQRLDEACDALEREGDVLLNPGGILYATPTRVVALEKNARIFSSIPTRKLAAALNRDISARAALRTVNSLDGLPEAVGKVSGVMVSPEAWSGIERTPKADAAFLEKLDHRLEWQALGAGSLEKDGELEWRTWQVTPEGGRWRRSNEGQLWWARTRFGSHSRVWTAGTSPSTSPFVTLSPDDADRARFALSRKIKQASVLRIEHSEMGVKITIPGWLPRPEYRWLSLHAEAVAESKGMQWAIPAGSVDHVTKLMFERLGLTVEAT